MYDNVNFKDTVRDEILEHTTIIRNLITAVIIIYSKLSDSGFQQSIHDKTKNLNIRDIFNAPAISDNDNGIRVRIFTYLISEAIKKVYRSAIDAIFNDPPLSSETEAASTIFTIPEIDRIVIYKIKF